MPGRQVRISAFGGGPSPYTDPWRAYRPPPFWRKALQFLDGGETVALAGDVAGFGEGAVAAETVQIERTPRLNLKTLETVARLQAGIQLR